MNNFLEYINSDLIPLFTSIFALLSGVSGWYFGRRKQIKLAENEEQAHLTELQEKVETLYSRIHSLHENLIILRSKINELEIDLNKKNVALSEKLNIIKELKKEILRLENTLKNIEFERN